MHAVRYPQLADDRPTVWGDVLSDSEPVRPMGIARFDDLTVMEPVDLRTRQRIPPKRRIARQGYGVV